MVSVSNTKKDINKTPNCHSLLWLFNKNLLILKYNYLLCAQNNVYNLFEPAFEYILIARFRQTLANKPFQQSSTSFSYYALVEINESCRHIPDMPIISNIG